MPGVLKRAGHFFEMSTREFSRAVSMSLHQLDTQEHVVRNSYLRPAMNDTFALMISSLS